MDFTLTLEQRQYQREIIHFARNQLNKKGTYETFSYELWNRIAEYGLFGITLSEEYGGLGESYLTGAIAMEALGYGCDNNGLVFAVSNHIWVALNMIQIYASDYLKRKYLSDMITGKKIGAFALTEADAGSDAMRLGMYAEETEGGYILNGSKTFISNGSIADVFIIIASTSQTPKKYTAFIVDKTGPGVTIGKTIDMMGLEACPLSEVILRDCFVDQMHILGKPDAGGNIMTSIIEWERCYEFAPHVGAMQRLMEKCIQYAGEREQFGKPIEKFQAISHKIADMQVAIELSRNMMYKVAWLKDQGKIAYKEASIFKLYVSEQYIKTCQNTMQIFGAYGYSKEYGIERELRDAMACSIYSGTSEIQRNTIYQLV